MSERGLAESAVAEPTAFRLWGSSDSRSGDHLHVPSTRGSGAFTSSRRVGNGEPPRVVVDYLADPAFSPHSHASESLLRCLPVLPARDADTALAALDATETDLRNQRTQMRGGEDVARDLLRHSLQSSARLRATTVSEADQAEAIRVVASEAGKASVKGLGSLVAPLRSAKCEKDAFAIAADLVALFAEDKTLDIVRSAIALAHARDVLAESESAMNLFEGDNAVLGTARDCVAEHIEDLSSHLRELVVRGASSSDASVVRMCLTAASKLSSSLENSLVEAAVDAIVDFDGGDVVSHGSSVLIGASTSRSRSRSSGIPFFPGIDAAVAEALNPLRSACSGAIQSASDFCSASANMFPDPPGACLLVLERLVHAVLVQPALIVIEEFQTAVKVTRREHHASRTISLNGLSSISTDANPAATLRLAQTNSLETVAAAETRVLDALAAVACIVVDVDYRICRVAAASNVPQAAYRSALDKACSLLRPPLSSYFELEKPWLDERTQSAYVDVDRVALIPERLTSGLSAVDESYHRYRVAYLNVAARLAEMTSVAVSACLTALRRSVSALCLPGAVLQGTGKDAVLPGREPKTSLEPFMTKAGLRSNSAAGEIRGSSGFTNLLLQSLVSEFVRCAMFLLEGLEYLLPRDAAVAAHPDMWASGSSPLASFCKTVGYVYDASTVVDDFLASLQLQAQDKFDANRSEKDAMKMSSRTPEWDEKVQRSVSATERRVAQMALRNGLEPVTATTHRGMESAVGAVADRLTVILSGGSMTAAEYAGLADREGVELGRELEPSMPFVSACAFLEQQLGVVRANLPSRNLSITAALLMGVTHDIVLRRWQMLEGAMSAPGGLQMAADGRAILQVFERLAPKEGKVNLLTQYGLVFSSGATELEMVIEARPLAQAEAQTLVDLISKRPDCDTAQVTALCRSLASSPYESGDE